MPERNLNIVWQPISLLRKNKPDPASAYYGAYERTNNMLRVMESVRASEGDDAFFQLYFEFGTRIHHDQDRDFDISEALLARGFDVSHASAFEDSKWDDVIAERMDAGLALVGEDVGTPIIAMDVKAGDPDSGRVGIFGPVITLANVGQVGLELWDALLTVTRSPGFWELKKTRTTGPEFGDRPVGF